MGKGEHLKNWHSDTPNAPVMPYNTLISNQTNGTHLMKKRTYNTDNIKPSKEFDELEYALYLKYATPEELESDKVSHTTAKKIIYEADGHSSMVGVFYKEEVRTIIDILSGK